MSRLELWVTESSRGGRGSVTETIDVLAFGRVCPEPVTGERIQPNSLSNVPYYRTGREAQRGTRAREVTWAPVGSQLAGRMV